MGALRGRSPAPRRPFLAPAQAQGRRADQVRIFPGIGPITGATRAEAEAKYEIIRNLLTIDEAIAYLGRFFDHHDFSVYPLDEAFPELGDIGANSFRSTTDRIKRDAREKGLTLRQVALAAATPKPRFIGSGEEVAEEMIRWVDDGAADGFILGFPVVAEGLDDFIRHVIPALEARNHYSPVLEGGTLRANLGLFLPGNRHSAVRSAVPRSALADVS